MPLAGWCRWAAAAPERTPTTGSRTCSACTCTVPWQILPQFQDLKVGDELPLGPGRPVMRVEVCDPERTLAIRFADGNWVWIFALVAEDGRTRLISRNRIATPGAARPVRVFNLLVMEPGSLVMERSDQVQAG